MPETATSAQPETATRRAHRHRAEGPPSERDVVRQPALSAASSQPHWHPVATPPDRDTPAEHRADMPADVEIPHDCDPETGRAEPSVRRTGGSSRLVGVDAARGLALLGMMVVHILPPADANGNITTAWLLSVGKSAALFAVVAGVGIALSTGRRDRPRGRKWAAASASLLVRALMIGAIGLAIGTVVGIEYAAVILPYYAMLFIFAIPLLPLRSGWLAALTVVIAVGVPIASHYLRQDLIAPGVVNATFASAAADPQALLTTLLVTGEYPALAWMAYICAGLAVGRSRINLRSSVAGVMTLGIGLAVAASAASWWLLEVRGGREQLEAVALQTMNLDRFTGILVWGTDGTLPTDSTWWLALMSAHTTTPFDLFFTIGTSLAVLGAMILLGRAIPGLLKPLAAAGSMTLTLYSAHLLLLVAPFMPEGATAMYLSQAVILITFALLWRRRFARGPLEQVIWYVAGRAGRLVAGRGRTVPAPTASVTAAA